MIKRVMSFLKSSYLVIVGVMIGATVLYVGALSIPTNIDNAIQTIKTIYISTDGISTSGDNVIVKVDNVSGAALTVRGNMNVGDKLNSVSGRWSTVAGGIRNAVAGDYSIIPGGDSNRVSGNNSIAMGMTAEALNNYTFVRSDGPSGPFKSIQANTFIIRATNGVAIGTGSTFGTTSLRVWDGTTGKIGTSLYCDQNGGNCKTIGQMGGGSGYAAGPTGAVQFNGGNSAFSGTNGLIWNNGKLGIGIFSPLSTLDVNGNSHVTSTGVFDGNVGIGTSSPKGTLDVYGAVQPVINIVHGVDGTSYLNFVQEEGGVYSTNFSIVSDNSSTLAVYGHNLKGLDSQPIRLWTNNTERMRIDEFGNVGIGTTGPLYTLDVNGDTRMDGDVAIGTTLPPILYSSYLAHLFVGSNSIFGSLNGSELYVGANVYKTSSTVYKRPVAGYSSMYQSYLGAHRFFTSTSGAAGSAIARTQRMIIDNSGNVGIATATPTNVLSVAGGADIDGTTLVIDEVNDKVGIGDSTPTSKLDVNGDTNVNNAGWVGGQYKINDKIALQTQDTTATSETLSLNSYYTSSFQSDRSGLDVGAKSFIRFRQLGAVVMTVSGGNVGIGNSTPTYKLDVNGTTRLSGNVGVGIAPGGYKFDVGGNVRFQRDLFFQQTGIIQAGDGNYPLYLRGGYSYAGPGGNIFINGGYSEDDVVGNVILGSVGSNVGIGTPTPTHTLEVSGTIAQINNQTMMAKNSVGTRENRMRPRAADNKMYTNFGSAGWQIRNNAGVFVMYMSGNGNIGINTTTPSERLEVNGNIKATAYYYSSDKKLKTNFQSIVNPLDKIMALNGYAFNWKADGEKDVGVVAQEVEKVFPELVATDGAGYKSVKYGNLVAPIIEAIKALYVKFVDQQKKIVTLEERVAKLEKLIPNN